MGKRLNFHGRRDLSVLTIHQESILLSQKGRLSAKEMDGENMVPSTSVVTFDSEGSSLVLHGEVISNGP